MFHYKGPFNNYVTPKGGGRLSDALRAVVNTTLKSVTKGGGGVKNISKKRYVIVEQPPSVMNSDLVGYQKIFFCPLGNPEYVMLSVNATRELSASIFFTQYCGEPP